MKKLKFKLKHFFVRDMTTRELRAFWFMVGAHGTQVRKYTKER